MDKGIAGVLANTRRWAVACGDSLEVLRSLPAECVQCVFTSPPYYQQRDYKTGRWDGGDPACDHKKNGRHHNLDALGKKYRGGGKKQSEQEAASAPYADVCGKCGARRVDKQIGLELRHDCSGWATGQRCDRCFVCKLTALFSEVRRVLTPSGIVVVNLADSFGGDRGNKTPAPDGKWSGAANVANVNREVDLRKNLLGIPHRFALSMQAEGWIWRNECPWIKPSPMPASVEDRLHVAHEYLFVFAKRKNYFWDSFAVRQPSASATLARDNYTRVTSGKDGQYAVSHDHETPSDPAGRHWRTNDVWLAGLDCMIEEVDDYLRHLRSIRDGRGLLVDGEGEPLAIRVASESYGGEHYAVFPSAMVRSFLKAAASAKGVCSVCLAPWERVVEISGEWRAQHARTSKHAATGIYSVNPGGGLSGTNTKRETRFCGWHLTCSHADAEVWPSLCLDPFGGSGTVGVVCEQLGLRSICIDLSESHCRQAEARIATALRTDELKTVKRDSGEPDLFAALED